jgi:hypothetical protein
MATKPRGGQRTTPEPGEKRPKAPPAPPMKSDAGCTCIEQVAPQLRELNAELDIPLQINFTTMRGSASQPLLAVRKINSRGKKPPCIPCAYCPFCGKKYPE